MDSRPPPPPQGAPPSYAFVTRVYRRNLRPVVIAVAFLAGLWTLFSAIGFFRNVSIEKDHNAPKVSTISIALGALYMGVAVIEAFGIFAAATQKLPFIRIYAFLTALVALIVIAAGLTRTIVHFVLKNEILNSCNAINEGSSIVYYGFWGPVHRDDLTPAEVADWCKRSFDRDSWGEPLAFLFTSVCAVFFAAIAFSYYRQVLDPSSPANASRAPQARAGNFPSHYNPPYDANAYGAPYGGQPYFGQPRYAPPPGPPPRGDDPFVPPYEGKPPGYLGGDTKGYGSDDDSKDDPFADEGGSRREERDVTSRSSPGGRNAFR